MTTTGQAADPIPASRSLSLRLDELLDIDAESLAFPDLVVVDLDETGTLDPRAAAERLAERLAGLRAVLGVGTGPALVGMTTAEVRHDSPWGPVLEQLTTTLATGDARWCAGGPGDLPDMLTKVAAAPQATRMLDGVLRASAALPVDLGLHLESVAYSLLLAGGEFERWRAAHPRRPVPEAADPVLVDRAGDHLRIRLNRPDRHNAWGRQVRDAFLDALDIAHLDDTVREVSVAGSGPSFCSGGDLDEFGTAPDVVTAHQVRLLRSAGRGVDQLAGRLGDRLRFELHGACIGAGIEIPAFAPRISADTAARFRLPELTLGLIPGAGGTVSIPRRIGRWRTAWMVLTGRDVDAVTALAWGLVDEVR